MTNNPYFKSYPWTNVYGVARSLLATGTLLTLLVNPFESLFYSTSVTRPIYVTGDYLTSINYFKIFDPLTSDLSKPLALFLLILVIIGWRPRITGLLHLWISWSFMITCGIIDGGDQITSILSLLILPICLSDSRKWHWSRVNLDTIRFNQYSQIAILSLLVMIRIQVCVIYFHSVVAKFKVPDWINGTAVWYWFKDPGFGLNHYQTLMLNPILRSPIGIIVLTWGAVLFELLLALALFLEKTKRKYLLLPGIMFHFAILFCHGLFSFFFAMAAALILYLRPVNDEFSFDMFSYIIKPIKRFKDVRFKGIRLKKTLLNQQE